MDMILCAYIGQTLFEDVSQYIGKYVYICMYVCGTPSIEHNVQYIRVLAGLCPERGVMYTILHSCMGTKTATPACTSLSIATVI